MQLRRAIPALALAAALGCAPMANAQRGSGHASAGARGGLSAGHSAPAFRSYSAPATRAYAPATRSYAPRAAYAARPAYFGRPGTRIVSRNPYGIGYGYPYGLGFYDTGTGFNYPGDYNPNDDPNSQGPYADPNAAATADPDPNPGPYAPQPNAYQPQPQPAPAYRPAQPAPAPEDATTLIFKDGRPPLQIHNYALTRTTLYVTDAKHRDIPVADLDLPATVKANADAGVPFRLPTP